MEYILILTLMFGERDTYGGYGGATVATQEFNTIEACEGSGELWKKRTLVATPHEIQRDMVITYMCVPKGEVNEQ